MRDSFYVMREPSRKFHGGLRKSFRLQLAASQRNRQRIQPQLAVDVAPQPAVELVEALNGLHDPFEVDLLAHRL